jgi:hypothetical protein
VISKRDGEWWVTTPLYVGEKADILRMSLCEHPSYRTERPAELHTVPETGDKIEMGLEKCVTCGATRSRYRYPDPERNKLP